MNAYSLLDLKPYLNNRGCTTADTYREGFLSLGSSSLPAEAMPFDQPIDVQGVPFCLVSTAQGDNMEMTGQTIDLPGVRVRRVHVLGVSNNGNLFDDVRFLQNGAVVQAAKLHLTDFMATEPAFSDQAALQFDYMYTRTGKYEHVKPTIWYNALELPDEPMVDALAFEDNPSMHVFALTLELVEEEV